MTFRLRLIVGLIGCAVAGAHGSLAQTAPPVSQATPMTGDAPQTAPDGPQCSRLLDQAARLPWLRATADYRACFTHAARQNGDPTTVSAEHVHTPLAGNAPPEVSLPQPPSASVAPPP